jgi:hypothetical protein
VIEGDDVEFKRKARDLLMLDAGDRTDAVSRIDDMIADGEIVSALVHQ